MYRQRIPVYRQNTDSSLGCMRGFVGRLGLVFGGWGSGRPSPDSATACRSVIISCRAESLHKRRIKSYMKRKSASSLHLWFGVCVRVYGTAGFGAWGTGIRLPQPRFCHSLPKGLGHVNISLRAGNLVKVKCIRTCKCIT